MDPTLYHYLKNKVTRTEPAKLADVITKGFLSVYNIPWELEFANYEDYIKFMSDFDEDILLALSNQMQKLNETVFFDPTWWQTDEHTFSKLLYNLRLEFEAGCLKTESDLYDYCLKMLYYAVCYYEMGLIQAPDMVFIEIYRIACGSYRITECH